LDALVKQDISTHLQLGNNYFSMHFYLKASKHALKLGNGMIKRWLAWLGNVKLVFLFILG
jgi:hypothetical protein